LSPCTSGARRRPTRAQSSMAEPAAASGIERGPGSRTPPPAGGAPASYERGSEAARERQPLPVALKPPQWLFDKSVFCATPAAPAAGPREDGRGASPTGAARLSSRGRAVGHDVAPLCGGTRSLRGIPAQRPRRFGFARGRSGGARAISCRPWILGQAPREPGIPGFPTHRAWGRRAGCRGGCRPARCRRGGTGRDASAGAGR